jgi:hypothetical protein
VEALIVVVALISLGMLAMRFGADSRPSIHSEEHRLAVGGMVWDAMSRPEPVADRLPASTIKDEPMTAQVVLVLPPAVSAANSASPFPILAAIDLVRGPDQPAFAADPNATLLEELARQVIDQSWSERVWLTGLVDEARFNALCNQLDHERQHPGHIEVHIPGDAGANRRKAVAHAKDASYGNGRLTTASGSGTTREASPPCRRQQPAGTVPHIRSGDAGLQPGGALVTT